MFCILTPFQCTFFGTFAVFATLIDHHIARNSGEGLGSFITAKLKAKTFLFYTTDQWKTHPCCAKSGLFLPCILIKVDIVCNHMHNADEDKCYRNYKNVQHQHYHVPTLTYNLSAFRLDQLPWSQLLMCLKYFASIELCSQFFNWSLIHHWFMSNISKIFNN